MNEKKMYPSFVKKAIEEGFDEIAELFEVAVAIEKEHEERYRKLLKNIEDKLVFYVMVIAYGNVPTVDILLS